ncbi:NADH:ubiquinone reductase (H(+)-translocating) [Handroanthus impetiginosus]|uniref:NADH-ubiquinone oxidoreductase chain 5 n=1 Tax=Handroanthus impetiginosus TaxID=429701 RepID=A0A2G9FVS1_9LAMI|nr:NADH:ubiquinone reductase (H(+)-translocating) [Handroanthus impetiginosus]
MFTTLYSVKVLYMTFLTNPNGPIVNYKHVHESDIFMSIPLIILALFSIFFGYITKDIFIGLVLLEFMPKFLVYFNLSNLGYNIYGFFSQRFLIELFYNKYITDLVLKLGGQTTKVIDKGSIELIGPYGLEKMLVTLSKNLSSLDTGVITSYALYILVGLIFYILMLYSYTIDNNIIIITIFALLTITKNRR